MYSAAVREFDITADKLSATFENIFRAKQNARRQAGQSGHCVVLVLIANHIFKGISDVYFVTKYGVIHVLRSAAWARKRDCARLESGRHSAISPLSAARLLEAARRRSRSKKPRDRSRGLFRLAARMARSCSDDFRQRSE
jgi:hypothetical protein